MRGRKPIDLARVRAADARLAELREQDPEAFDQAAERGGAWARGDLAGPARPPEKRMATTVRKPQTPVNLRLPDALLARADALVPLVGAAPELATVVTVTRSDILRAAILRGLAQLEAEYGEHQAALPGTETTDGQ